MAASGYFEHAFGMTLAICGLAASMLAAAMPLAGAGPRADGARAVSRSGTADARALPPALLSL